MLELNETHDPARHSWMEAANVSDTDFPIQNLPLGIFRRHGKSARSGVAIGDAVLDIPALLGSGLLCGQAQKAAEAASGPDLNPLLAMGNDGFSALRRRISDLLWSHGADRHHIQRDAGRYLVPMDQVELLLPVTVGGFTDFLCSLHHTLRMGRGNLPPSFKHQPIAYNGRPSSIQISGVPITRPNGQFRDENGAVTFGAEPALDYELEMGVYIGKPSELGRPIAIQTAKQMAFGYGLLNDWSARGIQTLESLPLGPFLGKSFATTISPWIVTAEALLPFVIAASPREPDDPPLSPHLFESDDQAHGGFSIELEAFLTSRDMRARNANPARVTATRLDVMHWTFAQMITHHASNGCNLRSGDLLGSGTLSGSTKESQACLAELNGRASKSLVLSEDVQRTWLEDGDEVVFRARAVKEGFVSLGFGDCRAEILGAPAWPRA